MRRRLLTTLVSVALLGACGGTDAPEPVAAEPTATGSTVRVSLDEIADVAETLPENVGGIDLGDATPSSSTTFCEAFAAAPARWVDDAVVPVQLWVDAFTAGRATAPEVAQEPIDQLLAYGQWKLDWNFKQREERPTWGAAEAEMALRIADAAVATCDDLPIAMGPPERWATPPGWADLSTEEIRANCDAALGNVAAGIEWYVNEIGTAPTHQEQIELAANVVIYRSIDETGDWPSGVMYVSSDFVGIGTDGEPTAVPGGACDL